jgi:hypothetical protein
MKIGFSKSDITPRVGVELCGFGPYRCRHSIAVRDHLWARAMAVETDAGRAILVSCDLVGVHPDITAGVRELVAQRCGWPGQSIMLCCTHTHSGPSTGDYIGWGERDIPYMETLPGRIARACCDAVAALTEAELAYAEVPCQGVGLNREFDKDAPPLAEVLSEDWRPAKPELTDTTCHVLTARAGERLLGFVSYFGCHPVVCCENNRQIHGDYCGVATNMLEREHPGAVGLFVQGANGDVNACVAHKGEEESLLALEVVAARYARAVRHGMSQATPVKDQTLATCSHKTAFTRKDWPVAELEAALAEKEERVHTYGISDDYVDAAGWNVRMETVYLVALRRVLARVRAGEDLSPETELQGLRLGPVAFLGSGFETMQEIKNDVQKGALAPTPLVCSCVNDSLGYAPDHTCAQRGGYAADMVPLICGQLPFARVHDELAAGLLALDAELFGD